MVDARHPSVDFDVESLLWTGVADLPSLVVLNVHTPRYKRLFRNALSTQRAYAERYGYAYHSEALRQEDAARAKWRKLEMVEQLLKAHGCVLLLDADCFVMDSAPDVREELIPGKDIYMAKGRSGRFNSGVMLVRSTDLATEFVHRIVAGRYTMEIDPENRVSAAGENGHVIQLSMSPEFAPTIAELSSIWNENRTDAGEGYILHLVTGPLRGRGMAWRARFARIPLLGTLAAFKLDPTLGRPLG